MKALIYLLQVSACTGIFYAFYFLFLRRLTFFTLNRWYLLATLLLSFVIPVLSFTVDTVQPSPMMQPVIYVQRIQQVEPPAPVFTTRSTPEETFDWLSASKYLYLGIAAISLAHLLFTLAAFFLRTKNKALMEIGNVKVIKAGKKAANSSFLNVIFINDDELEPDEVKQIIAHELLHIKLGHSADRLIARLVQIGLWFNPFAYLYMRSIEENHEFEVDRIAATEDDKGIYAQLLFKLAVSGRSYLFHSFSKVPLKKRIVMLFHKPTSNMKRMIYLLVLPVVVISCLAFANLQPGQKLSVINDLSALGKNPLVLINGKVYSPDMIYKIGGKCVMNVSTFQAPVTREAYKKYAGKMDDGLVVITTYGGKISYQTEIERENLAKKAAIPQDQFFTRLRLKKEDGSAYEEGMVKMPNRGTMSSEFGVGEKILFLIGGKAYPESEVKQVEALVRKYHTGSYSVGPVKTSPHLIPEDYSAYGTYYYFWIDTTQYRQKIKETKEQKEAREKGHQKYLDFLKSDDYKQKQVAIDAVKGKVAAFKVLGVVDTNAIFSGKFTAVRVQYGNYQYLLGGKLWHTEILNSKLQAGDEIEIKVKTILFFSGGPLIIQPEAVSKGGVELFHAPADEAPKYAFLYEANKVRFADGKLSSVEKYPNGKWKSAVILAPNGSKIKVNIKPNAPDFENIAIGEDVRFRFVHEVKTGNDYVVNDWVSLTKGYMGFGVKNPEYFYKFYEKV